MKTNKVYILAGKRTPIGSFGGQLASLSAPELAAEAIRGTLGALDGSSLELDEVLIGAVLQAGLGQAPARQAARLAGISDSVPATTINKVCASGMKAISLGAQSIRLKDANLLLAGGMESMSRAPFYAEKMRWGARFGSAEMLDGLSRDGLSDAYSGEAMGVFAELCAEKYGISRTQQDEYALLSYQRCDQAWKSGDFKDEVVSISVKQRRDTVLVSEDEEFKNLRPEKVSQLRPAFKDGGTVTAVNASKLSDGAAALLLASEDYIQQSGIRPQAEIVATADAEQSPEWFTTSPSIAAQKALKKAGLSIEDIDYVECNEAFSVVALVNAELLHVPGDRLNVFGGAVAMGHPLGCSGARIVLTLNSVLQRRNGKYGLAMICNGGGGASAVILKNTNYVG